MNALGPGVFGDWSRVCELPFSRIYYEDKR